MENSNENILGFATREKVIIEAARHDRDVFKSYVLEDNNGIALVPSAIHLSWSEHQERCAASGKYCAIIAPWGHGKTEQVVIGDTLFDLSRNPQLRIKIISNNDMNASSRVQSIKKIIEQNERFHKVFPDVIPSEGERWSGHQLCIKRRGASKDPSIEAAGVLTSGIGGRADKLVFDDPVDFKNAVTEPLNRQKVKESIKQTWLSRLDMNKEVKNYTVVTWIATPWHEDDVTMKYVMRNIEFDVLFQAINEPGMESIECKNSGKVWHIPLWEEKYNLSALQKKRRGLGERAYARGFRCSPYSDEDFTLQSFSKCLHYEMNPQEALKELGDNWRIVTGVDPSGPNREGFAIFTLACEIQKHIRVPLDIRVGAWKGREPIDQCLEVFEIWQPDVFVVENNSIQDRIKDWMQDAGKGGLQTKAFQTGRQKADPEAGVPGLDIEFSNNLWYIALGHVDHRKNPECGCAWCRWIKEMKYYPTHSTNDILMACWFAREEVRMGRSMNQLISLCSGERVRNTGKYSMPAEMRPKPLAKSIRGDILNAAINKWN